MRHLAAAALLSALALSSAAARERPTLWSLLDPDLIAQRILQGGVMVARNFADVTYGGMSVDLALGGVTVTDIEIWPFAGRRGGRDCVVGVDRMTLRTAAVDIPEKGRVAVDFDGLSVALPCLPPELRVTAVALGTDTLNVPRAGLQVDYDVPSAAADLRLHVGVERLAFIDLSAEFAYFFMAASDFSDRGATIYLDEARLTLEDAGLYNLMRVSLPARATDPDTAREFAEGAAVEFLTGLNFESAGGGTGLNRAQRDFAASFGDAWEGFVADPRVLVLESGNPPRTLIDFEEITADPRAFFEALGPRASSASEAARTALPVEMLRIAVDGDPESLSAEARLAVGRAFVTGVGAPRNPRVGLPILEDLASGGDGEASLLIAEALATERPADAYLHALRAGAAGVAGAADSLDRLERRIPFVTVLNLQNGLTPISAKADAFQSIPGIRAQALGRLHGDGMARSYPMAMMWASVGAALGDTVSLSVLERVEERVRVSAGAAGLERWADLSARVADLATMAWIDGNLPDLHSGAK